MYNKRKFGQPYQVEQKRIYKELLVAKKQAQESFLCSVLQNKGRCWTEFYKYVKHVKEIKKIFRRSRHIMASSLQIQ